MLPAGTVWVILVDVSVCCAKFELLDIDTDNISNSGFKGNVGFYCSSLAHDKWWLLSLP